MARKFQLKRGLKKDLPALAEGEPGFTTDEGGFYIGTGSGGNKRIGDNTVTDDTTSLKYRWGIENGVVYLEEIT